jgi:hypothetical protein
MTRIQHSLFCFLLCLLPALCLGQTVYEGQVINSVTELPIQGATVKLLKGNLGTQTNAQGYFRISIQNPVVNDTLQFSSVGYVTFKQVVTANQPQMIITLNASNTTLNEVRVTAAKSKPITLNKFNINDIRELETSNVTYRTMPFTNSVTAFCGKYYKLPQADMMLNTVKLGRRNLEWSTVSPNAQFLLHIVLPNPTDGKPGKTIFTKTVTLTDNAQLVTVDFVKDKVTIPGTGFFVLIEWLNIPYNQLITLSLREDYDQNGRWQSDRPVYRVSYQPALVFYTQYLSHIQWMRLGNWLWGPLRKYPEFNEITPAKIWIKKLDGWKEELCSHELALSATLTS